MVELKKSLPTKIRLAREIGEQTWANTAVPFFNSDLNIDDEPKDQILHAEGHARVLPFRVPNNPYLKWPKPSHREAFAYKMNDKAYQKKTTDVEKAHFIKKNELKEHKIRLIHDNVHYLNKDAIYRKAFRGAAAAP